MISIDKTRRNPVQIIGTSDREDEPGPEYAASDFVFPRSIIICRLFKLTLSDHDQAQVTLQLRVSLSIIV
jgi:hypothetical protein